MRERPCHLAGRRRYARRSGCLLRGAGQGGKVGKGFDRRVPCASAPTGALRSPTPRRRISASRRRLYGRRWPRRRPGWSRDPRRLDKTRCSPSRQSSPSSTEISLAAPEPDTDHVGSTAPEPMSAPNCLAACGGSRFWRSIHGPVVCATCHPPDPGRLLAAWIEDGVEHIPDPAPEAHR